MNQNKELCHVKLNQTFWTLAETRDPAGLFEFVEHLIMLTVSLVLPASFEHEFNRMPILTYCTYKDWLRSEKSLLPLTDTRRGSQYADALNGQFSILKKYVSV